MGVPPAASPDVRARQKSDEWATIFEEGLRLLEQVPDVKPGMERWAGLVALSPAIDRGFASGKGRPLSRALFGLESKLGVFATRIGLEGLRQALYRRGLYPRGTVERAAG